MIKKRGVALVLALTVIAVLAIFGAAIISRSVSESRLTQRYMESTQAFWLAEAAVNRALNELRNNYSSVGTNLWATNLGAGRYYADVSISGDDRIVEGYGIIPASGSASATRTIRATMVRFQSIPNHFYDNVVYAGGNSVINGNSCDINGDVRYAGTISGNTGRIQTGSAIPDPSISPLARLDFAQLRTISQAQGNYHNSTQLSGPFPTSFWYNQSLGIPNVVFLEGSLSIAGNKDYGGFFVVGGEVVYDASITGTPEIRGAIYSLGNINIRGTADFIGGVWSGRNTTIGGNARVSYNAEYMNAIRNLGINTAVQMSLWDDTQEPYTLVP
jgi:hypothetical protein